MSRNYAPELCYLDGSITRDVVLEVKSGVIVGIHQDERDRQSEYVSGLLLPGLANAHSHAFQRALRGATQRRGVGDDDFWSWREGMYKIALGIDPEALGAISRMAFLDMVEAGFTTVGEFHYLHHQPDGTPYDDPSELALRVIAAARDVGIRIALLRVVYARSGHRKPLDRRQT